MGPVSIKLKEIISSYTHIIIMGNGGSNSISSHISQDYTKFLNKQAVAFSDPARLTCYINDYGLEKAYEKYLEDFASNSTLVILISSSGESLNIYNAALFCEKNKIPLIKLSGFHKKNKLNNLEYSLLSYHVDSFNYGEIELSHEILLHSII